MPIDWVFVTRRKLVETASLGGTEQAVFGLSAALAASGDRVRLMHGELGKAAVAGADRVVAINDATLLSAGGVARNFVWFHNEVELLRETRRGRMGALLRRRPMAVFIGREQERLASRLFPFSGRAVIPYGLNARVLAAQVADSPPGPHAIFTSQAYRGLREVMDMWRRQVAPAAPGARFTAFIADGDVAKFAALATAPGMIVRGRVPNDAVLENLRGARVWLAPGHRSETFCMAAAEAVAMGVPIVTLGLGSLAERVRDGVDGFVCRDFGEMAARTRTLLTNDGVWQRMHDAGVAGRAGRSWAAAAAAWQSL